MGATRSGRRRLTKFWPVGRAKIGQIGKTSTISPAGEELNVKIVVVKFTDPRDEESIKSVSCVHVSTAVKRLR